MNAVQDNGATQAMRAIGQELETPESIVVISAHWQAPETLVLCNERPRTLYDFYGFPDQLYAFKYEAKGAASTAHKISQLLRDDPRHACGTWGYDHGSWTILHHMYPDADIPVTQVALDYTLHPSQHYEIGKILASLREEGVMFIGSGNIVHNLRRMNPDIDARPESWAVEFDEATKSLIDSRNHFYTFLACSTRVKRSSICTRGFRTARGRCDPWSLEGPSSRSRPSDSKTRASLRR